MAASKRSAGRPKSSERVNNQRYLLALGNTLRSCRIEQKLSLEQLAWNTGVDINRLSRIERGLLEPGFGTIVTLVLGLKIPLEDFMGRLARALTVALADSVALETPLPPATPE